MPASPLRDLAKQVADLDRRVRSKGSTSQLANAAIESGALRAFEGASQTMTIGRQWDGTYSASVMNGPTPPTPTAATAVEGTEAATLIWDGTFEGGAILPMDFLRVDFHVSPIAGFTPDHTNRYGTLVSPTGGSIPVSLPYGTYYCKLVCWSQAGVVSSPSAQLEFDVFPIEVSTDGFAPASSPDPYVVAGIDAMYVRWTAITNADPVWYDVHVSETLGFTPDSTTFSGTTQASQFTVKQLPGPEPADDEEDPRKLQYETPYYVRVIARDDDGSAAPSLQAVGGIFHVTGINMAADTITAANIATGTLTGELFSVTVIYAGTFKTAEDGQRVETGIGGIQGYKSDGSLMINFPTDPSQTALIDAQIIARGMTATGPVVLRSDSNSVDTGGVLKLGNGITDPLVSPTLSISYNSRLTSTDTLTTAQKTGSLGTFDLIPTEVSCIEWKSAVDTWVVHQIRPGGTRAWFFDYDGNPVTWSGGAYFADYVNWEIWSVIEITTSSAPKNGVYRMARWIPSGGAQQYYLWSPAGLNKYSRANGAAPPVVGSNGTDVYVAEVVNTDDLQIRYYVPNGDQNNLSAPIATYTSTTGYNVNRPLSTVFYDANGFDTGFGTPRYLTAERGSSSTNKLLNVSGTSLYPGGSGNNWASSTKDAETFEVATSNPRCVAWMPEDQQFWTYGGDGYLREHTDVKWDPSTTSSTFWAQVTYYDSNTTGGTHETKPSPARSVTWPRRSNVTVYLPPIPGSGGVDEPNAIRVYAGRGNSQPANTGMFLTDTTTTPYTVVDDPGTSGTNPPGTNTFPTGAQPAKIQSNDASLIISGDGTINVNGYNVGTTIADHESRLDAVETAPFWFGYLASSQSIATAGAATVVTGWTLIESLGWSTYASGLWTIPKAGNWELSLQAWWGAIASPVGVRSAFFRRQSPSVITIASNTVPGSAAAATPNVISKKYRFSAGDTVRVEVVQGQVNGHSLVGTTQDITWVQLHWVGP